MTLTQRVSIFFLLALASVLFLFGGAVYTLAHIYLWRQIDQQLLATFNTLVAAVELEPDDVKFEPSDHTIATLSEPEYSPVHWLIRDEAGLVLAASPELRSAGPTTALWKVVPRELTQEILAPTAQGSFHLVQRALVAPTPKPAEERDPLERESITVTVFYDTTSVKQELRWLAFILVLLGLACWLTTALVGQAYCRRALAPLRQMTDDARAITPADLEQRLVAPATGDELADLSQAFNALLDRLQDAFAREQRFTGDAAHQLRTPVTVLLGQIEVARRRERSGEEYRELLSVLHEQARELRTLIESLLFLARSGPGEEGDFQELELAPWLQAHLQRWRKHARGGDLQIDIDSNLRRRVRVSPVLLGQLLDNLLDNALKYSPPQTPVQVQLGSSSAAAIVCVTDAGPGIAAQELPHLFDPFYRSPAARQAGVPGTGIGLSVAARIAKVLGGDLSVQSQLGEGSRFEIRLPWPTTARAELPPVPGKNVDAASY